MDVFIGTIFLWPLSWAPQGWHLCDGTLLPINQYQAAFTLLGTVYGGDGATTFGLPNLSCRVPLGAGSATGLTTRALGANGGVEAEPMTVANLPSHTHAATFTGTATSLTLALQASPNAGNTSTPSGNHIANALFPGTGDSMYPPATCNAFVDSAHTGTLANIAGLTGTGTLTGTVANALTGSGTVLPVMQPFLALNYIICLEGLYPTRP